MADLAHKTSGLFMPTQLIIFGATGDLDMRYLLPTLIHMSNKNLLPKSFSLIAVSRRDLDTDKFLALTLNDNPQLKLSPANKQKFRKLLTYYRGNFDEPKSFEALCDFLQTGPLGADRHICYN